MARRQAPKNRGQKQPPPPANTITTAGANPTDIRFNRKAYVLSRGHQIIESASQLGVDPYFWSNLEMAIRNFYSDNWGTIVAQEDLSELLETLADRALRVSI